MDQAFNEYQRFRVTRMINERQEKRVRYHKRRAQYLMISYMRFHVFCLVVFSNPPSSSLGPLLQCKHWWIPFAVCLFISIIYYIGFLDAVISFYRIQNELDTTYVHQHLIYRRIQETRILNWNIQEEYQMVIDPDPLQLLKRKAYISFTIVIMLAFTVVVLYACRLLLCMNAVAGSGWVACLLKL